MTVGHDTALKRGEHSRVRFADRTFFEYEVTPLFSVVSWENKAFDNLT